jgi:hypothetical protein
LSFFDFFNYIYIYRFLNEEVLVNKFQKVGLAVLLAISMSAATYLPVWNKEMQGGQAFFPKVEECWRAAPPGSDTDSDYPCYKNYGGWWFGYVSGPAVPSVDFCLDGIRDSLVSQSNGTNYAKAKIGGQNYVSIVGPDWVDDTAHKCEGPPVTDIENGQSLLPGNGLEVELKVGAGINGPDVYDPDVAAVAVNLSNPPYDNVNQPPADVGTDMSGYGGFYLKYESNHTAEHDFALELGWDEAIYNYDTWLGFIKPASGVATQEFMWPASLESEKLTGVARQAGDFWQQGYSFYPTQDAAVHGNAAGQTEFGNSIKTAVKKMQAVKFRLKQMDGTDVVPPIKFKIIEFGLLSRDHVPVISKKAVQNVAKFNLNGRMLSMLSPVAKPVSVQVINLQGSLVHSQTLANGSINLSHLPAGIYIVRSPALGYSGRIMLK